MASIKSPVASREQLLAPKHLSRCCQRAIEELPDVLACHVLDKE